MNLSRSLLPPMRLRRGVAASAIALAVCAWIPSGAWSAEPTTNAALAEQLAPLLSTYTRAVKPGDQIDDFRDLFASVFRRVQRGYALEVDIPTLVAAAVKAIDPVKPASGEADAVFKTAINAALGILDPHSSYLDAKEHRSQGESISGSFGGLGIEVDMSEGLVRVVSPMDDSPASRAGLKSGDLIVRFDDQAVLGLTLNEAVTRMRGQPGTPITLLVRRPGRADDFSVALVRETIRTQALRARMEDDVLVLRLARFTGAVGTDIEKAIASMTQKSLPSAVVLDMRGNPGGLLNQAVAVADIFLSQGEIVSLRGRTAGNQRTWRANAAEQLAGVPMVVMLDGGSASAAELVAAALQENGRAVVMGQRSYGKGSVQTVIPLGEKKGALRLTTALYHGPSGRTVQLTGVGPDIELVVAATTPAARGGRREADRSRALPGGDQITPPKASVEQARCPKPAQGSDLALSCALAYIKAGGVDNFVATLDAPGTPVLQ
ncbi:MAG: S41 family peptidase [Burkholderiales bacterium]